MRTVHRGLPDAGADDDESDEHANLRKRYWALALKKIKETNGGNGPFSNVGPSKGNWINGLFSLKHGKVHVLFTEIKQL